MPKFLLSCEILNVIGMNTHGFQGKTLLKAHNVSEVGKIIDDSGLKVRSAATFGETAILVSKILSK